VQELSNDRLGLSARGDRRHLSWRVTSSHSDRQPLHRQGKLVIHYLGEGRTGSQVAIQTDTHSTDKVSWSLAGHTLPEGGEGICYTYIAIQIDSRLSDLTGISIV